MKDWWNKPYINRRAYILDHFEELTLSCEECMAVLLIDYMNEHQILISHGVLANKMKMDGSEIDDLLSNLTQKGYLKITYEGKKIAFKIDGIFDTAHDQTITFDQSLFDVFEREFARPLSQMELQRMSDWMSQYDQKLIQYALREAVLYGKRNFDYIERILMEWKKRKFSAEDYEDGKR